MEESLSSHFQEVKTTDQETEIETATSTSVPAVSELPLEPIDTSREEEIVQALSVSAEVPVRSIEYLVFPQKDDGFI